MSSLQQETLCNFAELSWMDVSWPGKFVLSIGFDEPGMALAMAVVGVGGACLTMEADATAIRKAGQVGASDFTVATLSEALRILKNEIRKGSPISVGLHGKPDALGEQMLGRGVQPDFVGQPATERNICLHAFVALGSGRLPLPAGLSGSRTQAESKGWCLAEDAAATPGERRDRDRGLVKALDEMRTEVAATTVQTAMQRWMRVAPRLFPRDRSRIYLRREMQ